MRQIHGFITPALRFGFQIARQEVGRVGFDDQPVRWNLSHGVAQVQAASFIADPAGDADVQIEIQIGTDLIAARREAMRHATPQLRAEFSQDLDKILVSIALMQEYRFAQRDSQLKLTAERFTLRGTRRKVAEIVETAFTDRDHFRCRSQRGEFNPLLGPQIIRVMGMNPGGTTKPLRMAAHEIDSSATTVQRTASDHHSSDASMHCALDNGVAIGIEAVVTQIQADIDEFKGRSQCAGLEGGWSDVVCYRSVQGA